MSGLRFGRPLFEVTSVLIAPASFGPDNLATRYAITMTAKIELRDLRENKVLWENPSVMFRQEHDATSRIGSCSIGR